MKKILTASTALVAAGMITAGAADAADKIKINVGGFSQWWVVGVWQDTKFQNATNQANNNNLGLPAGTLTNGQNNAAQRANVDIKGNNEIWFSGDTTLDNGMKVGVFVSLEAGGHSDILTDSIDKSYAWVEGGFGKVMLGTAPNGTALLHVQAPDAANNFTNAGIMNANFAVSKPASVMGMNQIVGQSSSMNTTNIIADDNAEKITYVAPSFAGLTVGATYVPSVTRQDQRGTPLSRSEAFGGGAMYANTFGPVGVKLSGGYVWVDLSSSGAVGERAYTAQSYGTQLSYAGFTLGGSVQLARDDHKSGALSASVLGSGANGTNGSATYGSAANATYIAPGKGQIDFGGKAFDVGLQYASGPYAVSLAYFRSEVNGALTSTKKDLIEFYQASGKYALGPGVDMLGSVGYAHYKDQRKGTLTTALANDALENSGWTAMSGLSLAF
ncbi:conserved exported hypothetical protein [Candidatus Terasakiella magnetica]|nr:conserved exported hypothetical protein [Candidatus Terasakiella magnetica]